MYMHTCTLIWLSFYYYVVGSSVITAIPRYMYTSVTSEVYNITVVCIIHPDSAADQCVVMAVADGRVAKTGKIRI